MSSSIENWSSLLPKVSSSIITVVDGGLSECLDGGVDTDTEDGMVSWASVLIAGGGGNGVSREVQISQSYAGS